MPHFFKHFHILLNYTNNKANYGYTKNIKTILCIYNYLKFYFGILKKQFLNFLNNNLNKKPF